MKCGGLDGVRWGGEGRGGEGRGMLFGRVED